MVGKGKKDMEIANLEPYEETSYMRFDSNQMKSFLRRSSYGADNSESTIKQVQETTMYNRFGQTKTTKNNSLPFRLIPRNQKG